MGQRSAHLKGEEGIIMLNYEIIINTDPNKLAEIVAEKLRDGYALSGGLIYCCDPSAVITPTTFAQAVVKYQ